MSRFCFVVLRYWRIARGQNNEEGPKKMEKSFLSVSEAARLLGMSGDWVRFQEKSGRLKAIRSAGAIRLFALEDVQRLAAGRQEQERGRK